MVNKIYLLSRNVKWTQRELTSMEVGFHCFIKGSGTVLSIVILKPETKLQNWIDILHIYQTLIMKGGGSFEIKRKAVKEDPSNHKST